MKHHKIGLSKHIVRLQPHDKRWRNAFDETKIELQKILDNYSVEIEHIGSTAIQGIEAKPVIDIAIGISNDDWIEPIIKLLAVSDYIYRGNSGENGGHLFVKEKAEKVRTHHIHIVNLEDEQWSNYIYFRGILRLDERLRLEYQKVKGELADKYKNDRRSYTEGKNQFINRILGRK